MLKTRLAPTPSGFLHLGNAFSFVLTWLWSRRHGAELFLRIDDADTQRVRPSYLEDVFYTLDFLGITPDSGPASVSEFEANYSQKHRQELYMTAFEQLKAQKILFFCVCSRAQLAQKQACLCKDKPCSQAEGAWRLDTEVIGYQEIIDWKAGAHNVHLHRQMPHTVIRKRDGGLAYQLCSLMDDLHFGINVVIRGADLWASSAIQLALAKQLRCKDFLDAVFYHHPLLLTDNGEKMAKSHGSDSVHNWRKSQSVRAVYETLASLLALPKPHLVCSLKDLEEASAFLIWPKIALEYE